MQDPDFLPTVAYTTEASESEKRAQSEVSVPDPSPELVLAALSKNEIQKKVGVDDKKLVSN